MGGLNEFTAINAYLQTIKEQILAEVPEMDVSEVMEQVEELLDLSITAGEFAIAQNLSEEELAIFDLLTKAEIQLTKQEEQEVKQVAKELLKTLKQEKLVFSWKKRQQTRASVEVAIKDSLDRLPQSYSDELYAQKCQEVYQHVYENYSGQGSIYDAGA